MQVPFLALVVVGLLAGCTTPSEEGTVGPGPGSAADVKVLRSLPVTMSVALGQGSEGAVQNGTNGGAFIVSPYAGAMLVEGRWTCTSPTCSFAVGVEDPAGVTTWPLTGDGAFRLIVLAPQPGTWDIRLRAENASLDVQGELRAAVFEGPDVPDSYSLFG